jgi:hypothetical protein
MLSLAAGLLCAGCAGEEPDVEPTVTAIRLLVGAQTVEVSDNGTVTGGPIQLSAGQDVTLTATFLGAAGAVETGISAAEFEIRVEPADEGIVSFTRTGAFAGTLAGGSAGSTTVAVALFHLVEMHEDFGPFNVPVTVGPKEGPVSEGFVNRWSGLQIRRSTLPGHPGGAA